MRGTSRTDGPVERRGLISASFLVFAAVLISTCAPAHASAAAAQATLSVTAADMANNLSWSAPYVRPGTRLGGYQVFRATSRKGPFTLVGTRSRSRSFTDRVSVARPYFYRVSAVSATGRIVWHSPTSENARVKMKKYVPVSGATLAAANGAVTLVLPAGALTAPQVIAVTSVRAPPTRGAIRVSDYFRFDPDGLIFSVPAQTTMRYRVPVSNSDAAAQLAPAINLVSYNAALGVWENALTVVSISDSTFTGTMTHFSYWTGDIEQPHGTRSTVVNFCQKVCHPIGSVSNGWVSLRPRGKDTCYQCHGNTSKDLPPAGTEVSPNIQADFIDCADQTFNGSTQSRHPVPDETMACSDCHNQHKKPSQYFKILRAKDAVTGSLIEPPKNGSFVGSAYCWACHGTVASASVETSDPGYFVRTRGDHKTLMASTPHETAVTAPTASGIKCLACHSYHASTTTSLIATSVAGKTTANDKTLCVACHENGSSGYPAATRIGSGDNQGYPTSGTWPGKSAYNSSAHAAADVIYPVSGNVPGACTNCHGPHGTGRLDMLISDYKSPKSYETSQSHTAYAMCIGACHDSTGPGPNIAASYESTAAYAGHRITYNPAVIESSSTAYLPQNAKLPCYECHNPHGSSKNNYKMFNAERSPDATVTTQRAFCTRCHRASNSTEATPSVAGMNLKRLPGTVTQHETSSTAACIPCHGNDAHAAKSHGSGGGVGCGDGCHGTSASHLMHTSASDARGPAIGCADCHGANPTDYTKFTDSKNLVQTNVCDACHSPGGTFNGLNSQATTTGPSVGAKDNWSMETTSLVYNDGGTALRSDKGKWCAGCHDTSGAVVKGQTASNKTGDNSTYGYFAAGHGKSSTFARMSWQDTAASGNGAANQLCSECHDIRATVVGSPHIRQSGSSSRLKAGYEDDSSNSNCKQCHNPGTVATSTPTWYTTYSAYSSSAHSSKKCSDCHDVHGETGAYTAMTKKQNEDLCNQSGCHNGAGGHPGVGSASFTAGGKNYTLECASCHNVHVVTGTYAQADQNKSPISRFSDNTQVWGDSAGEKIDAYAGAGGGHYRTPNGDSFSGAQMPDYVTFCQDCHGQAGSPPFGLTWSGDNHGYVSANEPNGYGTCPNWFACGQAFGWDLDQVTDPSKAWPVIPRGAGDQIFSREPYTHTQRIAGYNFVLSCTDCHTGHGTGTLGKSSVNNAGAFTSNWNNMCNYCHYYYSDWHAGMACGNASCHVTNSIHRAQHMSGSGGTRTFDPSNVLWYRFENNLNDSSSTWQMDGKWFSTDGSFAAGKSGQAAVLGDGVGVQVGTENANWSTDAGYHGTWVYSEMKFKTSLEAWVNPTDDAKSEYTIFSKHVGVSNNGEYALELRKVGGTLRAAFKMAADNNGVTQDGRAGIRGAYSSVAVPLNKWTHIAASFDTSGPAGSSDPSVGRIRIYINGEDKTTSDSSGNYMQPGTGEDSIYSFAENNEWNQTGVCYDDSWCAAELAIGGFDWESTNYIGKIDDAKLWNVSKDATYFATYDSQAGPSISSVEGVIGSNQLKVTFSEGVYTNTGGSGALVAADFSLTDTDTPARTISSVTHTAGSATATVTMSTALDDTNDINVDTLAAVSNAIYDEYNNACDTTPVTIVASPQCPDGQAKLQLNEAPGTAYVSDEETKLSGKVYGSGTLTGSQFNGDGTNNYIDFEYNPKCLQADTSMTIETKIYPKDTSGTSLYVKRIMARDGGANWQLSLWRNNGAAPDWTNFNAGTDKVAIALWVNLVDSHGGNSWKPVLTEVSGGSGDTAITGYRWYRIKVIWNTSKSGGTPGQPFVPAEIWVDDRGPNDDNAGELWSGWRNATDADQSQHTSQTKLYQGDTIKVADGAFTLGANVGNHANNVFNGKIDYFYWQGEVDEYRDGLAMLPEPPQGIGYLAFLARHPDWLAQEESADRASTRNRALALAIGAIGIGLVVIRRARKLPVSR